MIDQMHSLDSEVKCTKKQNASVNSNLENRERNILSIHKDAKADSIHYYHLVQYTPHIHFQHYENGACLKGSEVKPKLDKFIKKFCKKNNIIIPDICYLDQPVRKIQMENGLEKEETKTSLDYKIQIFRTEKGTKEEYSIGRTQGYLGNDNGIAVIYKKGLQLVIIGGQQIIDCPFKLNDNQLGPYTLADLIDYVLPAFFILNCFGARSTKGFGSYGIENKEYANYICKNDAYVEKYLTKFVNVYYVVEFPDEFIDATVSKILCKNEIPCKNGLDYILTLSSLLKSGFNTEEDFGDYYKGRIFRYFTKAEIGSDKAFIKKKILSDVRDTNKDSMDYIVYNKYLFTRAMLGLAPMISFPKGVRSGRTVFIEDTKMNIARNNTLKREKIKIIRFNNPIHFIPNGKHLLIVPTIIPSLLSGRQFSFIEKTKDGKRWKNVGEGKKLFTPLLSRNVSHQPDKFNLESYIDWFIEEYNQQIDMQRKDGKYKEPIKKLLLQNEEGIMYLPEIHKVKGT